MPTIADARRKYPALADLDDQQAVEAIHEAFYADLPIEQVAGALGVKFAAPPAPLPEPPGLLRGAADLGLEAATGVATGVKMLTDVAGADNPVSQGIGNAIQGMQGVLSPYRQAEMQNRQRLIDEAQASGSTLNEIGAYMGGFAENPLGTMANVAGTAVPTIAAALVPGVGQARLASLALGAGVGAAQGVGTIKSSIYDTVKAEAIKAGHNTPEQAEALAVRAQEYGGQNSGQIALGGALGAAAGSTGAERLVHGLVRGTAKEAPGMLARVGMGAASEALPEAAQGGQEQLAGNLAAQRAGFDVPTMRGVAGSAALEGAAGGVMGGGLAVPRPAKLPESGPLTRAANAGIDSGATSIEPVAPLLLTDDSRTGVLRVDPNGTARPETKDEVRAEQAADADRVAMGYPSQRRTPRALDVTDVEPKQPPAAPPPAVPTSAIDPTTGEIRTDPVAQREADRPPEPTEDTQPGDILNASGQPFKNMRGARNALQARGEGHEIVRVVGGLVVRKTGASDGVAPGPDVGLGRSGAVGADEPSGSLGGAGRPDGQPEPAVPEGVGADLAPPATDGARPVGDVPRLTTREQPSMLGTKIEARPAGTRGTTAADVLPRQSAAAPATAEGMSESRGDTKPPVAAAPDEQSASWVIREKATGNVIAETFDKKKVDALNVAKYEAVPIREHLAGINKQLAAPVAATKTVLERRRDAVLDKQTSENGKVTTRRQWVESKIAEGLKPSIKQEDKIKPMSRMQFFRATNEEQRAHERRIKEAGKKDVHWIGYYEVTKIEHDYAQSLLANKPANDPNPQAPAEPQPQAPADQAPEAARGDAAGAADLPAAGGAAAVEADGVSEPTVMGQTEDERRANIDAETLEYRSNAPEVAQPTKGKRIKVFARTLNGVNEIVAHLYEIPGYKGPQLAVKEYKTSRGQGYRVYLPKSGAFITDSNGVSTLEDTLELAVLRIKNARDTITKRDVSKAAPAIDTSVQRVDATHKDPGEPAEPATAPVVAESLKTAARNDDRPIKDVKADALRLIDEAIAAAPSSAEVDAQIGVGAMHTDRGKKVMTGSRSFGDGVSVVVEARETRDSKWSVTDESYDGSGTGRKRRTALGELQGTPAVAREQLMTLLRRMKEDGALAEPDMVSIDIPGDGEFKVLNTKERLTEFRRKVAASPGFKAQRPGPTESDRVNGYGSKQMPGSAFGVEEGSGSKADAFANMVDDGDMQAALDYAEAAGIDQATAKLSDVLRKRLDKFMQDRPVKEPASESAPLYASRALTPASAQAIRAWAASQGFNSTLPADDLHVTVAYSREPMDGAAMEAAADSLTVEGGKRTVEPLGDGGAVVLKFESADMQARWRAYRDAGASWDYDSYTPHVTITYDGKGVDLSKVKPYAGPIELGPERQEPLNVDKADDYKEAGEAPVPTAPASEATPPAPAEAEAAEAKRDDRRAAKQERADPKTGAQKTAIADFGEKLEGARKDYAAALKDAMDVDVAAEPLSKSWPEPDYQKLLDGGADPYMVAFIHAARDELPTKPQKPWKLKGWVQQAEMLRGMAQKLLSGDIAPQTVRDRLAQAEFNVLQKNVGSRAELYGLVGHTQSLKGITFAEHQYSFYRGENNVRKWVVEQKAKATAFSNWPRELAVADSKADMLAQFKAKIDSLDLSRSAKKQTQFVIYRKRGEEGAFVGKKIGREYIDLHKAADLSAARVYLADNTAALEAALEKYREAPMERRAENQPRVGDDHRNGAPVTTEVFADTFGFRGVQFGNYVEQGRRQSDLNEAYDALMDMAAVLGIPPRALSLNGRLGLAFGARGKGGKNAAAAHFEPDRAVINLTKGGGPGSLAHEWWHSLDNYFSRESGDNSGFVTGGAKTGSLREPMRAAFQAVKQATQAPTLRRRAAALDKRRTKPYWNTPHELSARAFESYLIAKLQDQNAANDYLANVVDEKVWSLSEEARATFFGEQAVETYPYPGQAELPAVRAAFDEFFKTVETRTDDTGNVAMFSRTSPDDGATVKPLGERWAIVRKTPGQGEAHEYFDTEQEARDALSRRRLEANRAAGKFTPWWVEGGGQLSRPASLGQLDSVARADARRATLAARSDAVKSVGEGLGLEQLKDRAGYCFKVAAEASAAGVGDMVIGLSCNPRNEVIWHAVVQRDGMVYDPTYARWFEPGVYEALGFAPRLTLTTEQVQDYIESSGGLAPTARNQGLGEPAFSRAGTADGASVDRVRSAVDEIIAGWQNAPTVEVVSSMADPRIPQAVRDADQAQRSQGATGSPEGFWYGGKVYLVADQLAGDADVRRVLWHESLGHYGLRGMFGSDLAGILDQIIKARPADLRAKMRAYGLSDTLAGRRYAAEELLAELAQTRPDIGFVKRAIAAIRAWLKRNGFDLRLTDSDIIANLIRPARVYVERGAAGDVGDAVPAFRRNTRQGSRWTERATNTEGPEFYGNGIGLIAIRRLSTDDFAENALPLGHGIHVRDDHSIHDFIITDSDGSVLGTAALEVDAGGNVEAVHDIEITDKRAGSGRRVMESIIASAPGQVRIIDIVPTAESFWNRMGAGYKDVYGNATTDWESLQRQDARAMQAGAPQARRAVEAEQGAGGQAQGRVAFSRSATDALRDGLNNARALNLPAGYLVGDFLQRHGKLSWWDKTVGTPYNLAKKHPRTFGRVYDRVQEFLGDVSYYATEAADKAPSILPKLESLKDIGKSPLSAADTKAVSAPIFEGTLGWLRTVKGDVITVEDAERQAESMSAEDKAQEMLRAGLLDPKVLRMWQGMPVDQFDAAIGTRYQREVLRPGVVWTDAELRSRYKLDDRRIGLYREFRSSVDESLRSLSISEMVRLAGEDGAGIDAMSMGALDASTALRDRLFALAETEPDRAGVLNKTADRIVEIGNKVNDLMKRGYAPLSRFGNHTLDVVDSDGERVYFGLFESQAEANKMARQMRREFPKAAITQGTRSEEEYRLFQGVNPETIELFGEVLGLNATGDTAADLAYQSYLKRATATRSALKRLIHRKGIAGFSEDAGRVLAGFLTSNARRTSGNLHLGQLGKAVEDIPQGQGELKDYAVKLAEYVSNPQEEAQAIRGLLFAQFLGGSVASAMVNMTQPVAVTFPFLSQFGGARQAAAQVARAFKDLAGREKLDPALTAALKKAEEDGIVSPQEIFQLQAQARGQGALKAGDGTAAGDAAAKASNATQKLLLAWGKLFGAAEQINRRVTFIAAYRVAQAQGMADPAKFAGDAVVETQFAYNKGNKPKWARGAVGGTLFTFKQYWVNYVELLSRLGATPDGRRAMLLALGVLFLTAGADGLPFMEDAEDVVDGFAQRVLGIDWSTKQRRNEFLARQFGLGAQQFIANGVSGLAGVPIDVSGRLGMGNLIPGTGVLQKKSDISRDILELAGPAGSLVQSYGRAAGALAQGDVGRAVREAAPVAAQNVIKAADMLDSGMYRDARGRKVIDTETWEAAVKALGFQPNTVARVQEAAGQVQRSIALVKVVESEIADLWARGIFEQDRALVDKARESLKDWNRSNPASRIAISIPQIRRRVAGMREDRATRLARTAPPEIRARVREELAK